MTFLTTLLASSLFLAADVEIAEWSQWGGPHRDFVVPHARPLSRIDTAREVWRRPLGEGDSGIVGDSSAIYTVYSRDGRETAIGIDSASGETLWTHDWAIDSPPFLDLEFGAALHSTPALTGDLLVVIGGTGHMVAVDRHRGTPIWTRELWSELDGTRLERGYAASPLIYRDRVIVPVGGDGKAVVALAVEDGRTLWAAGDGDAAYASPILIRLSERDLLVALLDEKLLLIDPGDGRVLLDQPVRRHRYVNCASPFFDGRDRLYVNTSDGLRAFRVEVDPSGPRLHPLWVSQGIGSQVGNILRVGDQVYGTKGSSTSYFVGVDAATGETLWRDRSVGDAHLLRFGDHLLALEETGSLALLSASPSGLAVLSRLALLAPRSWTPPTPIGRRLYLRDRSEMVALELP